MGSGFDLVAVYNFNLPPTAADIPVKYSKSIFNKNEHVLVDVGAAGTFLVESELNSSSSMVDVTACRQLDIGPVTRPGFFAVHISSGRQHYVALLSVIPFKSQFEIIPLDVNTTEMMVPELTPNLFDRLVNGINKDRVMRALHNAAVKFPVESAAAIGSTVAICIVTVGVATTLGIVQPALCLKSGKDLAVSFAQKVTNELIDVLQKDGQLTVSEAKTLKALWVLVDLKKLLTSPEKLDKIVAALSVLSGGVSVTTDNDVAKVGAKSTKDLVKKSIMFYKFNKSIP